MLSKREQKRLEVQRHNEEYEQKKLGATKPDRPSSQPPLAKPQRTKLSKLALISALTIVANSEEWKWPT